MNRTEQLYNKTFLISNVVGLFQTLVNYVGLGGAFFVSAYYYSMHKITVVDFALISYLMSQFTFRLDSLAPALSSLHAIYTDAQKIIEFCQKQSQTADSINATPLHLNTPPSITFESVTFSYPTKDEQSAPNLDNISFTIDAGETVAIVGESGAGKSTIIQLLLRFYQCSSGRILIDGIPISDITRASLLDHITVVSQDAGLFNSTVQQNIKYGNLEADIGDVIDAAYYSGFLTDREGRGNIQRLEQGVGERGQKLSGGEKQRVAIARALLKGGLILLLDEPTSALDAKTAREVQENLNKLKEGGATTLVVTHKLYTLTDVNKIIYLKDGKIVETGTFEELCAVRGNFYSQLEAQCKDLGIDINDISPQKTQKNKDSASLLQSSVTIVSNWKRRHQVLLNQSSNSFNIQEETNGNESVPLLHPRKNRQNVVKMEHN